MAEADECDANDDYLLNRDILLRNYQLSILEKAKKGNTVVYLPTGAGKTLIAVHLLCSKSREIIGPFGNGGKRAFFVSNTQIMVFQLKKVLETHTKFKVAHYVGDMCVDSWNQQKWLSQFQAYHVFVLTAEILRLVLQLKFIKPKDISIIVFDECHHAVYDHPYKMIIQSVHEDDPSNAPLLLGLSAVLLNSNVKPTQVISKLKEIETLFRGKIITETQELREIIRFSADPKEELIYYHEDENAILKNIFKLYESILEVLNRVKIKSTETVTVPSKGVTFRDENRAKRIKNGISQAQKHLIELGPFGAFLSALFFNILFEKYRLLSDLSSEIELILYVNMELNKIRHGLQKIIGDEEGENTIFRASSHKVKQLICLLENIRDKTQGKYVSILLFVHQRSTAIVLAFLLKKLSAINKKFRFLKPEFITSTSVLNRSNFQLGIKNEEIVKEFASRSLNLLVATNILEEGFDVCACNVVISFDFPLGYPSYFQSRGRARSQESTYYMFVKDSDSSEKLLSLTNYRSIKEELFEKISQNEPSFDDESSFDDKLSLDSPEKIVLIGKVKNITLDGITAIKVVDRYCSKLPQDKFCFLSPKSWYEEFGDQKKAFVQLPLNSPLRDVVEGALKDNSKLAKRSAYLAVVKRLYEMKELNEDLTPRTFERKEEDFEALFPHYIKEKIDKTLPQPGTRKRKQMYRVKCSEALSDCLPRPGAKSYLHVIDLSVMFDKPKLQRRIVIYDVLKAPATFAIISSKKLRKIFQFPLFIELGQINCDLLVNYEEIVLTETEIEDIKTFHFVVFEKVSRVLKNSQIFDKKNKQHSFLIAPVAKDGLGRYALQWDVIRCDFCRVSNSAVVRYNPTSNRGLKRTHAVFQDSLSTELGNEFDCHKSLVPVGAISGRFLWSVHQGNEEPKFAMTEANYNYFVISPSYRYMNHEQLYIVGKVCHDMSPLSPFPNNNYSDYASYYKHKYDIEVTNSKQPLLKVSAIHSCSNYNKPRQRISRRARDKYKEFDEHFIPELCDIFPFDRRFWLKANLLPTVLNRLYHVYFVEEFRRKIVSETGLGSLELPEGMIWKPLKVDVFPVDESAEDTGVGVDLGLKSSLPLSKLRDKAQIKEKIILDPERHLDEVGLCDLEFYVKRIEMIDLNYESEQCSAQETPKENEFMLHMSGWQQTTVPVLKLLNCSRNNIGPDLALLVQASTSKSANDMVNYERLEILGDSFLKFAATLFLFRNYPDNEGILSAVKGKIVGNRNLLYCGVEKGIHDVLNVNDFVPSSDWNPPLFCVPEKLVEAILKYKADPAVLCRLEFSPEEQFMGVLSEKTLEKNINWIKNYEKSVEVISNFLLPFKTVEDKTISDCVEAFIGAYLLTLGVWGGLEFLMWLGVLPRPGGSYSELIEKPFSTLLEDPSDRTIVLNLLQEVFYSDLEYILNYRFNDKALLLEALTHSSCCKNRVTGCYQRLELLGDAILDFLITTYVYENCGEMTPGDVTDIRSALVNNVTFACLVVRYEIHKYLLSFSSTLNKAIENFVLFQINRNHAIDDNVMCTLYYENQEIRTGGFGENKKDGKKSTAKLALNKILAMKRLTPEGVLIILEENDCYISETIQVPKALGDLFESLAGAIYLDSGNSLEAVWNVYYRLMKNEIQGFTKNVPKTALKLLHDITGDKPYYECKVIGDKVKVTCTIYYENQEIRTHGFGENKKDGKKSAAKLALNKILAMKKSTPNEEE